MPSFWWNLTFGQSFDASKRLTKGQISYKSDLQGQISRRNDAKSGPGGQIYVFFRRYAPKKDRNLTFRSDF